jgi:glycosyltransferase involved in cell wall biosynthesis
LEPAEVVPTLRNYDALIFPSYYQGEGHPGVLVEAMMAGLPIITTQFRSIPELVQDGVNGLLMFRSE